MPSASTMILTSLRKIGEKIVGGTLTANEETAYRGDLNSLLESWSLERLMVFQSLQESFTLTANVASTTIGSSATFAATRPTKITQAFIRDSNNNDYPLQIIPMEAYNRVATKTVTSPYPRFLAYDQGFDSSGYGRIWLYETPSAANTLFIDSWQQLTAFSSATHTVLLPPGYQLAIESNLAIWLAAGYRAVPNEVVKVARDSKAAIKGVNLPDVIMRLDAGVMGRKRTANIEAGY